MRSLEETNTDAKKNKKREKKGDIEASDGPSPEGPIAENQSSEDPGTQNASPDEEVAEIPMSAKLAMEFIGTFFLCLTVALSAPLSTLAPIAIGSVLMCFVYAGAHVSGANYNPAVSLALAMRGALSYHDAMFYIIAQLAASLVAGCTALLVMINEVQIPKEEGGLGVASIGHPTVNRERFSVVNAFVAEAMFTFALCFVVLNVATSKAEVGNQFFGLAIGFTVTSGACSVGSVSGGAFNPAVGFGLPLCAGAFEYIPLYILGPLTGASLASFLFYVTHFKEFEKEEKGS